VSVRGVLATLCATYLPVVASYMAEDGWANNLIEPHKGNPSEPVDKTSAGTTHATTADFASIQARVDALYDVETAALSDRFGRNVFQALFGKLVAIE